MLSVTVQDEGSKTPECSALFSAMRHILWLQLSVGATKRSGEGGKAWGISNCPPPQQCIPHLSVQPSEAEGDLFAIWKY